MRMLKSQLATLADAFETANALRIKVVSSHKVIKNVLPKFSKNFFSGMAYLQ